MKPEQQEIERLAERDTRQHPRVDWPVAWPCAALGVSRSAFACLARQSPSARSRSDAVAWSEGAGAAEIAKLKAEAEKQINIADDYTQACGHDRRDEELAQLQAVLRGEKTLASLPPRV